MHDVFISYSSADRRDAEFLRDFLESRYIPCWMAPRDIPAGENYAAIIPQAIRKARFFLILVSQNSTQSEQVANELNIAATDKRCIIACHLDNQPLSEMSDVFRYHLGTKQWIDGYQRQGEAASEIVKYIRVHELREDHDPIRCPHCGCDVLKQKRELTDNYLYPQKEDDESKMRLLDFLTGRNAETFQPLFLALQTIPIFCVLNMGIVDFATLTFIDIPDEELGAKTVLILILLLIMILAIWLAYDAIRSYKIMRNLRSALSNSDLKYHSLKCTNCEKTFGVVIPRKDTLKDWISVLVEENSNQK